MNSTAHSGQVSPGVLERGVTTGIGKNLKCLEYRPWNSRKKGASSCSPNSRSIAEHVQVTETITRCVLGLPCKKISGEKNQGLWSLEGITFT